MIHMQKCLLECSGIHMRDFSAQVEHRNEKRCIDKDRINRFCFLASPLPQTHLGEHRERFSPLRSFLPEKRVDRVFDFCGSRDQAHPSRPGFWQFPGLLQSPLQPPPTTILVACTHRPRLSPSPVDSGTKFSPSDSGSRLCPADSSFRPAPMNRSNRPAPVFPAPGHPLNPRFQAYPV